MQQLLPAAEKLEAAEENCDSRITADSTFKPKPLVHKSLNQSLAIELVTKKTDDMNKLHDPHQNLKKMSSLRGTSAVSSIEQTTNKSNNDLFKVQLRPSRPSLGHWGGAKKAKKSSVTMPTSKKPLRLNEQ